MKPATFNKAMVVAALLFSVASLAVVAARDAARSRATAALQVSVTSTVGPGTYRLTRVMAPRITRPKPVGYQTFYETARRDTQVASRQAYYRFDWSQIETAPGEFNFAVVDAAYTAAKAAGQRINFRIMPFEDGNAGPVGLKTLAGYAFKFRGNPTWQPNLDDSAVQADLDKLLAAMGVRYAAGTATIDVGWFGPYGEWSNYKMDVPPPLPSTATWKWLIAEHQKYFPESYTIVQEGLAGEWNDLAKFNYALSVGCGVRWDSWHSGNAWQEQEHQASINACAATQQWTKAPMILEPWGTSSWSAADWQQALAWAKTSIHAWMVSTKGQKVPPAQLPAFRQFCTGLGTY
jgi:hypothetical protein